MSRQEEAQVLYQQEMEIMVGLHMVAIKCHQILVWYKNIFSHQNSKNSLVD
jgi:hypothetical protein